MKFTIITLFPQIIEAALNDSILKKAQEKNLIKVECIQLRNFAIDKAGTVDDIPYGGGGGMLLRPEPLAAAITKAKENNSGKVIFFTPQGEKLKQEMLETYAEVQEDFIIICGHYEGIDQRIRDKYVDVEISMGDFVLTGGELPTAMFIDGVTRLLPGAINNRDSHKNDSHSPGLDRKKEHPHYTRPEEFEGSKVPEVLLSGHHANIETWRKENLKD